MTNTKKVEFRKLLAEFIHGISNGTGPADQLAVLEKMEAWVDKYASEEIAAVIGKNSKLRIN